MNHSNKKTVRPKTSKANIKLLVNKFYGLRKQFEDGYTGKLRCHKYEETREFTIALSFAIFEANQLLLNEDKVANTAPLLNSKLIQLQQNFLALSA